MRHTFRYVVADDLAEGDEVVLGEADSHHLARVVRRRAGDPVELIDPDGGVWQAVVVRTAPPAVVRVAAAAPRPAAPAGRLTLYQGLADWGRLDTLVEKAVELGVGEIVLFRSARARRVPGDEEWTRRRERLARVAEAAARQSGRAPVPGVRGLVPFESIAAEIPGGEGLLIDPRGDAALPEALGARAPDAPTALVVGPEAGFSADEVASARAAGLPVCRLGPEILRAETAALAVVALAASRTWGRRP